MPLKLINVLAQKIKVAIVILIPSNNSFGMDNDSSPIKKKASWPKRGFMALIGLLGVMALVITPSSLSPMGGVSATWTEYGSYISTLSSIHVYDDKGVLLGYWTKNTNTQHFTWPVGTVIGNITVSGILSTTELAHPSDPRGCLDLDVWFVGKDNIVHTYYNYNVDVEIWLDSDDWYFIMYFTQDALYPSPGMETDCVIEYDYTHTIGAKMRLMVP